MKTLEELKKINTKNLLRYYKAERNRFYGAGFFCSCCGENSWEISKFDVGDKEKHDSWKKYLELIKKELDTREHVIIVNRRPKPKKNKR